MAKRIRTTRKARELRKGINLGIHLYALHPEFDAAARLQLNVPCDSKRLSMPALYAARRTWARLLLGIRRGK